MYLAFDERQPVDLSLELSVAPHPSERRLHRGVVDTHGRIRDKTHYPFVDDPALLGTWTTVDFVEAIDDFHPGQRRWKDAFFLRKPQFAERGRTKVQRAGDRKPTRVRQRWTNGLRLTRCPHDHTAEEYVIESIDGVDYLFLQWKSGGYTANHHKPGYYVMRRADD